MNMPPVTPDVVSKLKADHPDQELHLLNEEEADVGIVVKVPTDGDWKRFQAMLSDDTQRSSALRTLLLSSVVFPSAAEFGAVLAALPGLAQSFGAKLCQIAGAARAVTAKKL